MPTLMAVSLLGLKVKAFNHLKQEATEPNTVTLLSMCFTFKYGEFLVFVNILGNKTYSDSDILSI